MSNKNVEDYLTDGIYGARRPKESERVHYLGTLRERIILALTKGQVMTDSGLATLEEAMKKNKDAKLLINGHVAYRFLKEEKALANKYNIPYTSVTNEESDTNIGAILTYDYAIDKEDIFIAEDTKVVDEAAAEPKSFISKLKKWFT